MALYRWYQDNTSVTVEIFVPVGTLPTQLRLLLSRRRLTLRRVGDEVTPVLVRKMYAPIQPRCTDCYTMTEPQQADGGRAVVRAVIYKSVAAGWLSLFAGDKPSQDLIPSPAPMSHAMMHVSALANAKEAAVREAAAQASARGAYTLPASQQSWRHGCNAIWKKTPGGDKVTYGRDPPMRARYPNGSVDAVAAMACKSSTSAPPLMNGLAIGCSTSGRARGQATRVGWSAPRRLVPEIDADEVKVEQAAAAAAHYEKYGTRPEEAPMVHRTAEEAEMEEAIAAAPKVSHLQLARRAALAVRKGEVPECVGGTNSSDDDEVRSER